MILPYHFQEAMHIVVWGACQNQMKTILTVLLTDFKRIEKKLYRCISEKMKNFLKDLHFPFFTLRERMGGKSFFLLLGGNSNFSP